jgi:hypothetical protein
VKELRQSTGAGMMDCKKALAQNDNNMELATEWLRKKGLASADKKAGRVAAEGAIATYIHPGSRIGVLIEVNCETDFVAVSDKFQELVGAISMQIAASPSVDYVAAEDIPAEVFEREKLIEMEREDIKSKPEAIRAKIAEGRVQKLGEWAGAACVDAWMRVSAGAMPACVLRRDNACCGPGADKHGCCCMPCHVRHACHSATHAAEGASAACAHRADCPRAPCALQPRRWLCWSSPT